MTTLIFVSIIAIALIFLVAMYSNFRELAHRSSGVRLLELAKYEEANLSDKEMSALLQYLASNHFYDDISAKYSLSAKEPGARQSARNVSGRNVIDFKSEKELRNAA